MEKVNGAQAAVAYLSEKEAEKVAREKVWTLSDYEELEADINAASDDPQRAKELVMIREQYAKPAHERGDFRFPHEMSYTEVTAHLKSTRTSDANRLAFMVEPPGVRCTYKNQCGAFWAPVRTT